MPDKYRYNMMDLVFDSILLGGKNKKMDICEKMKIEAGPRCCKCQDYVDKTLKIYIRMDHKLHGPQEYCRKCVGDLPDEKFESLWLKQKDGKRIMIDIDQMDRDKRKKAMDDEMSIFKRVKEPVT